MEDPESEITELRYKISRFSIEIKNLEKMLQMKTKNHTIEEDEAQDVKDDIENKRFEIRKLENQIVKIENNRLRETNFKGRGGIEKSYVCFANL
jgi:chromosome segregation ATPase